MKAKIRKSKPKTDSIKVIYCDDCKNEFSMNTVNIDEANIKINGQELILVYFVCSKCNKIYPVLLKDEKYYELKVDLEVAENRMRKIYGSGNKELARTLNSMVAKKLERLRNHVDSLNKKFSGTFTFVTSENNHKDKIIKYLP